MATERPSALRAHGVAAAGFLILFAGARPALAQEQLGGSAPVRVYDMPRPAYDPPGILQRGFLIHGEASEAATYDDNILASPQRVIGDFISDTNESATAVSQWSRHSLSGHIFGEQQVYARHATENAFQFGADGSGRIDIARDSYAQVDVAAAQLAQPRATPQLDATAVGRPVYNNYSGTASVFGRRMRWFDKAGVTVHETAYINAFLASGSGTQFVYFNRLGHNFSDYFNIYIDTNYAQHEWRVKPEFRNFNLLTTLLGTQFQIPDVLSVTLAVGAIRQDYYYAAFSTLVSPTFNLDFIWNITPLTTFFFNGQRQILGTENFCGGTPGACAVGNLNPDQRNTLEDTQAIIGAQHEFRHNLLGQFRFKYERDEFDFSGLIDDTYNFTVNARYLINRHWEANLDYAHNSRTANQPGNHVYNTGPFEENVVSLTLKGRL